MANLALSSVPSLSEDVDYTPTPISSAFSQLLGALARHIEADRDIETVDIWNTAFSGWLRCAEEAHTDVVGLLSLIRREVILRSEDRPLQRMAMLIDAMIGSETPGEFKRLHGLLPRFENLFRCGGTGVVAQRIDRMLLTALERINEMATLDTYDDDVAPLN